MLSATLFAIRPAFAPDEPALNRLAYLAGNPLPARPVLIGMVDGVPAAAIGIERDELIVDPGQDHGLLRLHLRVRAAATRAYANRPDLADRIRAAMKGERLDAPRVLVRR